MPVEKQVEKVTAARGLAKWFQVEITLSMFGKVIWHYVFPPKSDEP